MCTPAAQLGVAGVAGGTALNAYGQEQALRAMENVWRGQNARQQGYNEQLQGETRGLIRDVNPASILGLQTAQERQGTLDTSAQNLVNAIAKQNARKGGGARGGVEAQAQNRAKFQSILANALQDDRVRAMLAGLMQGGQNMDLLGRRYGLAAGNIRNDAQRYAQLAPGQEQAAGLTGGWARSLGSTANTLGQLALMSALSQPTTPGEFTVPGTDVRASPAVNEPWQVEQSAAMRPDTFIPEQVFPSSFGPHAPNPYY